MYKKKDIIIIIVLFIVTSAAVIFWIYNDEYFTVGKSKAVYDKENRIIFVSLPDGSDKIQKISFNIPFKNKSIYIKKISSGNKIIDNPVEERLINNSYFDFGDYISHSKLIIYSGESNIEYDLWVTTGEIPIISIYTEQDIPDEPKIECTLSILSTDKSYIKNDISAGIELIDVSASIPKASYSLNIREELDSGDVPDILGFEKTKRFRLSAAYMDNSLIREKLSYDIFKSLSDNAIAPNGRFVEVYENNSYRGLYILYERADRIMFSLSNYKPVEDTHSVIYEIINRRGDFTGGNEGFSQVEPDTDNDGYYYGPLFDLEDLIINAEKEDFLEGVDNMLDVDSVLDNHILFLLSGCTNGLASNNYIYKGKDTGDRFKFSPGSLYLESFGIDESACKIGPETMTYPTRMFNRLYEEAEYRERLKTRWNDLRKDIITQDNIYGLIDKNINGLDEAIKRNFSRWPTCPDSEEDYSFGQEIDYLKEFIEGRIIWLDSYINFPMILKIGDQYAKIDEETGTIFCALDKDYATTQKINWSFPPGTEVYLENLPDCSSILGRYLAQKSRKDEFEDYSSLISGSKNSNDITIFLDRPSEDDIARDILEIVGWAVDSEKEGQGPGIKQILLFDGPDLNRDKFLGKASLELPRTDVVEYYKDDSLRDCGFEIYVSTFVLNNGRHELYLYAFDGDGNYTIKQITIEVKNDETLANRLKEQEADIKQELVNNEEYDFFSYIFHGRLTIKKDNNEKAYDLYVTTSDIPMIIIYAGEKKILNNEKINTDMQIIYHDPDEKNFIDSLIFDFYGKVGIEIRGKTSLAFPKKQYSFEIRDDNDDDMEVSLLGMPEESDWILGAPYSDKTLMRNVLAFQISNEIGIYAPRTRFVEVFLDSTGEDCIGSEYLGVYYLAEKIKRDNNRVNIEKMNPAEESGSYILEISSDAKIEPGDSVIITDRGLKLVNIYPRGDEITPEQKLWITDYLNEFEQALYSDYFIDPDRGYRKYIDVDSFIDYIIINELFKNAEAFHHSTFLYKDKDGKLKAGPVWDFNLSSGNTTEHVSIDNEPVGFFHISGGWKTRFFSDEYFVTKYIDRWKQLRENEISDESIIGLIEQNKELLSEAQFRNFNRWDILGKYVWPNPEPYAKTYDEEVEKLKEWLLERAEWIDNSIDSAPYKSRMDQ